MYSLTYKVTTSTCDSEGKLKLYSALQMMQDCSEMWIDSEPGVTKTAASSCQRRKVKCWSRLRCFVPTSITTNI